MQISDIIISPKHVFHRIRLGSKKQALQDLSMLASRLSDLPAREIFDVLLERERLGTTGVGHGVAIPHGRFKAIDDIVGLFAQIAEPIDWEAADGEVVDLVFLLLVPYEAGADHLQALARVSSILRDLTQRQKLRQAESHEALFEILTAAELPAPDHNSQ
jgi:PTS system nitrogen regulatory IIA component